MKNIQTGVKVLISLFLLIAVGVHVAGLFVHVSDESVLSHIIHLLSYSICLFAFLRPVKFRLIIYSIGMLYPVFYHACCFFKQLLELKKFNLICLEVIVILPMAAVLIWQNEKRSAT